MELLFFILLFITILTYYGTLIIDLLIDCNKFETKKEVLLSLIPFYRIIKTILKNYNELN